LKIPFALTTTDLQNGEELIHTSGDLVRLVRASCSWPGFFSSVDVDGRMLVDGGLRNSVPTKAAYLLGGTFVVAVNPGFAISSEKIDNAFKALAQSIQIMGEELNAYQAYAADLAICPEIKNVDQFGFDKSEYIMKQGDIAAEAVMEKLKRKLMIRRII
ncbi:MAG TPA: patatin-like phospholipase family protein, partial [Candidatus Omnitrophota bacterium]|nr:patatin-like phospholipase family protein [Candidatus Omnitrophota bacterium]